MESNFSTEDIIIRILPGGFFLAVCFFMNNWSIHFEWSENLDFLYTFLFLCSSFICGELLQTISHFNFFEFFVKMFFRCKMPSQIFLYKNNPVVKNEKMRNDLIKKLNLTKEDYSYFNKEYKNIRLCSVKTQDENNISQKYFWEMYHFANEQEDVKTSNRNFLFLRVLFSEFFILTILFFLYRNARKVGIISLLLTFLLLRRERGVAKGLVFKIVLHYFKS